jgi:hypothetical protein
MRNKTNDPTVKANADRSLLALKSILTGIPEPLQGAVAPVESSARVMHRFAEVETHGKGLTPDGWPELAGFFVKPPKRHWDKILIVGDFQIDDSSIEGDRASLAATYVPAGELDSSLRLLNEEEVENSAPLSSACCTEDLDYTLVFSEKHWETSPDGESTKESTGPAAWRIEEYPPEPWITIDTAIRYVTQMRENSTDPVIKKNAEQTLAILKRYKLSVPRN